MAGTGSTDSGFCLRRHGELSRGTLAGIGRADSSRCRPCLEPLTASRRLARSQTRLRAAHGLRSFDLAATTHFTERTWRGSIAALRGPGLWREGEIARSGSWLRLPLLAVIERAYSARQAKHAPSVADC